MQKLIIAAVLFVSIPGLAQGKETSKYRVYDCLARVLKKETDSRTVLLSRDIKADSAPRAKRKLVSELIEKRFELVHVYCQVNDKNLLEPELSSIKKVL